MAGGLSCHTASPSALGSDYLRFQGKRVYKICCYGVRQWVYVRRKLSGLRNSETR